jgi:hypothetical protein
MKNKGFFDATVRRAHIGLTTPVPIHILIRRLSRDSHVSPRRTPSQISVSTAFQENKQLSRAFARGSFLSDNERMRHLLDVHLLQGQIVVQDAPHSLMMTAQCLGAFLLGEGSLGSDHCKDSRTF